MTTRYGAPAGRIATADRCCVLVEGRGCRAHYGLRRVVVEARNPPAHSVSGLRMTVTLCGWHTGQAARGGVSLDPAATNVEGIYIRVKEAREAGRERASTRR